MLIPIIGLHNVPTGNTDVFSTHRCNVTLGLGARIFNRKLSMNSEKLTVPQYSRNNPKFMKPETSFPL